MRDLSQTLGESILQKGKKFKHFILGSAVEAVATKSLFKIFSTTSQETQGQSILCKLIFTFLVKITLKHKNIP